MAEREAALAGYRLATEIWKFLKCGAVVPLPPKNTSAAAKTPLPGKIGTAEANQYCNETLVVPRKVVPVTVRPNIVFLNLDRHFPDAPFTAVIFPDNVGKFGDRQKFKAKNVEITGTITEHQDKPGIVLESPKQIKPQVNNDQRSQLKLLAAPLPATGHFKSSHPCYDPDMDIDLTGFSATQQEALLELLILSMYADGHLSTYEDEQLQKLLAGMGFTEEPDRQREFDAVVTRIRPFIQSIYKAKTLALSLADAFTDRTQQKQVFAAVEEIMTFDQHVSNWESTLLMELRLKFRL